MALTLPVIGVLIFANRSHPVKATEQALNEMVDNTGKIDNLSEFKYAKFTLIQAAVICTIQILFNCPHTR